VDSEFSSKAASHRRTDNISSFGNWKLTGSGLPLVERDQDAIRKTAASGSRVEQSSAMELLGEAAYGRGNSETFFGARYETTELPEDRVRDGRAAATIH